MKYEGNYSIRHIQSRSSDFLLASPPLERHQKFSFIIRDTLMRMFEVDCVLSVSFNAVLKSNLSLESS